ncbi:superoxide dismutase, Fe-Mn family [Paenibacillus sp. UNCCL117]|uniref:Fe-Mn family superoxide dismutase n=1 Tax=unclassified Paenibacillus TaxID=185978 RepID=UPI0008817A2A|nr:MULTISPECIES: Fe-Mn family superoxide dismutase [unclassified Paenibacillus]SDE63549.1 superoxide dismutase, Fe-Mn family [Paenibacillus sp. cl123]SFW70089.1 superoxide dismutase, Fe-Mn family [Paenibacillus sp. UNCCL117]
MLVVYGALLPLRILEEIRFWKMQEREHTVVIRELVPDLEPEYVQLLDNWEEIFAKTEAEAIRWIEALIRLPSAPSPQLNAQIHELLRSSTAQSQAFVQQLFQLMKRSAPIQANPVVQTVVLHIIRESEYFLGVLQAVQGLGQGQVPTQAHWHEHGPGPGPGAGQPAPHQHDGAYRSASSAPGPYAAAAPARAENEQAKVHIHLASGSEEAGRAGTLEGTWSMPVPAEAKPAGAAAAGATAAAAQAPVPPQPASAEPGKAVPIGGHRLPPLPYAYDALEPHIDAKTMRIHHDKHHQSYVDGLNKAEKKLQQARETGDFDLVKHWERELAFNGAGHYLHTLFWNVMKPGGGGQPAGPLAAEIRKSFGSFEAFQKQFSAAADKVEGGGWAILVWSPRSHRLEILQAEKHQNLSQWDVVPLLPLDVWEHAYYLKHQNERAKYIEAWWHTVNWAYVNERFNAARTLLWPPF